MSGKSDSTQSRYMTSNGMEITLSDDESRMYVVVSDIVKRHTSGIYKELEDIKSTLRGDGDKTGLVAEVKINTTRINKLEKYIFTIATSVGVYLLARLIYGILEAYIW